MGQAKGCPGTAGARPAGRPIMEALLRNIFPAYLLLRALALVVFMLYPIGRKAAEDDLQRVGVVNHAGEAPRLLRRRRDIEHPNVTIWEFDNRGVPLKEWEDKQARIETALDIIIAKVKYGKGKRRVRCMPYLQGTACRIASAGRTNISPKVILCWPWGKACWDR